MDERRGLLSELVRGFISVDYSESLVDFTFSFLALAILVLHSRQRHSGVLTLLLPVLSLLAVLHPSSYSITSTNNETNPHDYLHSLSLCIACTALIVYDVYDHFSCLCVCSKYDMSHQSTRYLFLAFECPLSATSEGTRPLILDQQLRQA